MAEYRILARNSSEILILNSPLKDKKTGEEIISVMCKDARGVVIPLHRMADVVSALLTVHREYRGFRHGDVFSLDGVQVARVTDGAIEPTVDITKRVKVLPGREPHAGGARVAANKGTPQGEVRGTLSVLREAFKSAPEGVLDLNGIMTAMSVTETQARGLVDRARAKGLRIDRVNKGQWKLVA